MLIQITNHCTMNCPHCMQNSTTNGNHMSVEVFRKTLEFGVWSGCWRYNISGGEPTEHPCFEEFMAILHRHLLDNPMPLPMYPTFTVESNGEWIRDAAKVNVVKKILKYDRMEGFQVSSFRGLYRNFDFIQKYRQKIGAFHPRNAVVSQGNVAMPDLGRARHASNASIRKAVEENTHMPCCINGYFISKQTDNVREFSRALFPTQTCKPFVDWKGNVHGSESMCCPAHGNVMTDSFETIWQNLRKAVPCGKCHTYRNLLSSNDPKIVYARTLMNL